MITPPGIEILRAISPAHRSTRLLINDALEALEIYHQNRSELHAEQFNRFMASLSEHLFWTRGNIFTEEEFQNQQAFEIVADWIRDHFQTMKNAGALLDAADRIRHT